MALAPLRSSASASVLTTTLQAVSGAGYPGVAVVRHRRQRHPGIGGGEEDKIESEPSKILGTLTGDRVIPHPAVVSAHTTRVPVLDGHTMTVSVAFDRPVSRWRRFRAR